MTNEFRMTKCPITPPLRISSFDINSSFVIRASSFCIKPCPAAGMLLQNLTWRKFLFALRQPFEFIDDFFQSKMLRETQRPATERRETGSQNHSVVRVLG